MGKFAASYCLNFIIFSHNLKVLNVHTQFQHLLIITSKPTRKNRFLAKGRGELLSFIKINTHGVHYISSSKKMCAIMQ